MDLQPWGGKKDIKKTLPCLGAVVCSRRERLLEKKSRRRQMTPSTKNGPLFLHWTTTTTTTRSAGGRVYVSWKVDFIRIFIPHGKSEKKPLEKVSPAEAIISSSYSDSFFHALSTPLLDSTPSLLSWGFCVCMCMCVCVRPCHDRLQQSYSRMLALL